MKKICIIGSGAAGLLLLLNLEKHNVDPKSITIIDPTHNGGDIMKKWLHVRSNTIWRQILDAVPTKYSAIEPWCHLNPEEPCELRFIITYLQACTKEYMSKTLLRTDTVVDAQHKDEKWSLTLKHGKQPLLCDVVFFCQGSEPKSLDLPFPSIPLDVALDSRRLLDYVQPGQHILVFGTAHSGTLIVKNLVDIQAKVTNFYASEKPFCFACDGEYDGVKQEADAIARKILDGSYPNVTLESVNDMAALVRASKSADACIYACGFEPRVISDLKRYDGLTGRIDGTVNAWGFGIAFPNRAPDEVNKPKVYWDVSIPSFLTHIEKQMPDILASLQ